MGFMQRWRLAWVMARPCVVVLMVSMGFVRGGSDGVSMGIVAMICG